jgi:hypothetical protein
LSHLVYIAVSVLVDEVYQEEMIRQSLSDYINNRYENCDPRIVILGRLDQDQARPVSKSLVSNVT